MSKSISAALEAHYASGSTTLAILVKITRVDGLIFGLTGHDQPILYPPNQNTGLLYETGAAAPELAAIVRSAGVNVDNSEIDGAISDLVQVDDIEAGDWRSARLEIYRVNYRDLSMGHELIGVGELGQTSHDGRSFKVEFMGRTHKLGRVITRHYLPTCDADLGDARCGVNIEPLAVTGTVVTVTDNRVFTATHAGSPSSWVANYHTYGRILWLTGANAGRGMEIRENDVAGLFTLQLGMKRAIVAGDTFKAYPGCNKLKKTDAGVYGGDCVVKFNNAVNFRGFDEIPGIDKIIRPAYAPQ
jgi:uncharacterized phage protein (TIGR02218 family)